MATKLWVGDKIFLVDDEVYDEWERLTAEVKRQKHINSVHLEEHQRLFAEVSKYKKWFVDHAPVLATHRK